MSSSRTALCTRFLLVPTVVALASLVALDGMAAEEEYVTKAKVQTLHQGPLPGTEGKEVIIKHFTAPPEFVGGKHYHPGPVYVYVLEGELTIESEGKTETYGPGELYPEPLNTTMQPKNLSASDDLKFVLFQVGDVGKPLMIKAE